MKKILYLSLFLLITRFSLSFAQNNPVAYRIFDKQGKEVTFSEMADALAKSDIVLFGELHNNPVVHWLQLELTEHFQKSGKELMLGAEMFEADDQLIINEFLAGYIKHSHLTKETKVWNNYETDYRPLMDFAKEHQLPFIATNVPRRYASMVAGGGIESLGSLSKEAKSYMVPLPFKIDMETPGYGEIKTMSHGMDMSPENFVSAQAIKDATMAHFILKNYDGKGLFLHFNGDFHSRQYGGIYWYIKAAKPKLNVMTISSVESADQAFTDEQKDQADFIIILPENMTKTY